MTFDFEFWLFNLIWETTLSSGPMAPCLLGTVWNLGKMILCKKNLMESMKNIFYVKRAIFGFCVFYLKEKIIEVGKVNCVDAL